MAQKSEAYRIFEIYSIEQKGVYLHWQKIFYYHEFSICTIFTNTNT